MLAQRNPTRFGSLYGPALAAAAEVEVVLYATATRLAVTAGGDHVDHVELRTLNGLRHRVVADQYVVALGGIETARLLLASNDVVPAGVGNGHDLVGRHFNDHRQLASLLSPSARTRAELALYDARWTTTRSFPTPENASNTVAIQGFMELREETMRREGLPNLHLELIIEDAGSVPAQATGVPIAAVGELLAAVGYRPGATVGANLYVESVVNRDSRVRLSPTKVDALGMPVVELDHHRLPADEAHVERGLGIFAEAFEATGLGRLQLAVGWVGFNPSPPAASGILPQLQVTPTGDRPTSPLTFGTTYHHMCTARMATDPADGVVDADGRVHETDNLHLAGSAVFPTGPGTHPTLTVVALALRLARHLDSAVLA